MKKIRSISAAGLLAVSVALSGCGDSLSPEEIVGFYELNEVNGLTVPDWVELGDISVEFRSGWWRINSDGTWASEFETSLNPSITNNTGTWEIDGVLIIFSEEDTNLTTTGAMAQNRLTIRDLGIVYVYLKTSE